jgi:hypothetical protein
MSCMHMHMQTHTHSYMQIGTLRVALSLQDAPAPEASSQATHSSNHTMPSLHPGTVKPAAYPHQPPQQHHPTAPAHGVRNEGLQHTGPPQRAPDATQRSPDATQTASGAGLTPRNADGGVSMGAAWHMPPPGTALQAEGGGRGRSALSPTAVTASGVQQQWGQGSGGGGEAGEHATVIGRLAHVRGVGNVVGVGGASPQAAHTAHTAAVTSTVATTNNTAPPAGNVGSGVGVDRDASSPAYLRALPEYEAAYQLEVWKKSE